MAGYWSVLGILGGVVTKKVLEKLKKDRTTKSRE